MTSDDAVREPAFESSAASKQGASGPTKALSSAVEAYETIRYEVVDGVCLLTLARPDRLNAFNVTMLREMLDAFDRIDADDAVRAVVVTGAGRAFCAGADLSAGSSTFDYAGAKPSAADTQVSDTQAADAQASDTAGEGPVGAGGRTFRDGGGILTLRIFRCLKPVIAAVNGAAVGVGATMLLPMDIRLASETARFGFVFTARGIVPEACSSWFLPRAVGMATAAEWVYTARLVSATEAHERGLVRSLHPDGTVVDAAMALAAEIAANAAPVSVALARRMMWEALGFGHPMDAHRVESAAVSFTGAQPDAREGIVSFLDKRPPRWSMSVASSMPPWTPGLAEPEY